MTPHPLLAVVGPTASGKSDLALALAERLGGEIVNCDSVQLYRYLDIGTAKTPPELRRGIPHHLIDIIDPDEVFTAGQYQRVARAVLREVADRGRVPVIVGGTGFYLRALIEGLFAGPAANPALRNRLAARPDRLEKILRKLDPISAARIHANDTKKLIRAIEVCLLARRPMSEIQTEREPLEGFDLLTIGLDPPRSALYQAIDERCRRMFERGLIAETHSIVGLFGKQAKALEAIGYNESTKVIDGMLSVPEGLTLTRQNTRRYAKRQMTWFRQNASTNWLLNFGYRGETMEAAIRLADSHIKKTS
jgi:tRNA dimethylallyltransferase